MDNSSETTPVLPAPEDIVRTESNPHGRTDDFPYGFKSDGTPRRAPIRLLSALESLVYWLVIVAPIMWFVSWQMRDFGDDGGQWFDRMFAITLFGWIALGLVGNVIIRILNVAVLRTDMRRPSTLRQRTAGTGSRKGYRPPKGL